MKTTQAKPQNSSGWERRRWTPELRFTPTSWAKLLFLRDLGDTEVGGFGISSDGDLLLVEDVRLIRQQCTAVTVKFDDEAVADFFDEQIDAGKQPEQVGRIWIHTHPCDSATPSCTDEETFARSFGGTDWALMFVLAQGGQTYARLRFNVGPGGAIELPVDVDFRPSFAAADPEAWAQEYAQCVADAQRVAIAVDQRNDGLGAWLRDEFINDMRSVDPWDDRPMDPSLSEEEAYDYRYF